MDRSKFYLDMMPFEVLHGLIDRACPFKAEIASARWDRNLGQRIRLQSRSVQIQLRIFKPISPTSIFADQLDSDNVTIKRV